MPPVRAVTQMNATHFREALEQRVRKAGSQRALADRLKLDRALIARCLAGGQPTPQLLAAMDWECRAVPCNEPPFALEVSAEQMAAIRGLLAVFGPECGDVADPGCVDRPVGTCAKS